MTSSTSSSPAPAAASARRSPPPSRGHNVIGHSSRGGDGMIAADLSAPARPDGCGHEALERLGGRIDALVNNAGIFEAAPVDLPAEEWTAQWERTMRVNLTASAELCRLAVLHFREEGGRTDRQRRQPRRLSRRQPAALALCRVQGGDDRDDQVDRPRLCGRQHPRLRRLPRLHRLRDGRGLYGEPRRREDRRRHPARPGRRPPTRWRRRCAGWPSTRPPRRPGR